jgi:hypothetical protein
MITNSSHHIGLHIRQKIKERKTIPMLPPMWIMVLLHFLVDFSSYVIPKCTYLRSKRIRGSQQPLLSFEGEHLEWAQTSPPTPTFLEGKCLGFHTDG